jgi:glycosyltransferase involved in cell wall biosynthesis
MALLLERISVIGMYLCLLMVGIQSFKTTYLIHRHGYQQHSPRTIVSQCQHTLNTVELQSIPSLTETKPLKVLLCVEPTPFNYMSGYANRFQEMLRFMKLAGDEVCIITPDNDPKAPKEFEGFPIVSIPGGSFTYYPLVTVSMDLRTNAIQKKVQSFKPDIIHVSTPSMLVFPAMYWAKRMNIPLVMSYHTDIVSYAKSYSKFFGIESMVRYLVKSVVKQADLTLCTSPQLRDEMLSMGINNVDVWRKGINTEVKYLL